MLTPIRRNGFGFSWLFTSDYLQVQKDEDFLHGRELPRHVTEEPPKLTTNVYAKLLCNVSSVFSARAAKSYKCHGARRIPSTTQNV